MIKVDSEFMFEKDGVGLKTQVSVGIVKIKSLSEEVKHAIIAAELFALLKELYKTDSDIVLEALDKLIEEVKDD